ncbi:MAG: caspase family protein [Fimbriimonadaceae bacterium]|nr:caspase family protein [Fimbriimonadaceae bacterium]
MRHLWLAVLLCGPLSAATLVLSVGVEKYDDERISSLQYAVADARAVAAAFRAAGVPPRNVTLLASDEREAARRPTRIAVLRALERLREQARPGDRRMGERPSRPGTAGDALHGADQPHRLRPARQSGGAPSVWRRAGQ